MLTVLQYMYLMLETQALEAGRNIAFSPAAIAMEWAEYKDAIDYIEDLGIGHLYFNLVA